MFGNLHFILWVCVSVVLKIEMQKIDCDYNYIIVTVFDTLKKIEKANSINYASRCD